jgi:hypothetical protein
MSYQVKLIDRAEREERIRTAIQGSARSEDFRFFRDQATQLPVIRIPTDVPVYRLANFRTYSDQAEYMSREKQAADYFRAGQERESVQQVQHEILARLAAMGKASSVVPIVDALEREGQQERLLITGSGVVVNGNRRLAAMRELHTQDPQSYGSFSHVDCMVLPIDATPVDVLEIEAILQARPETKLDYNWIGDAELLTAMLEVWKTPDAVAKRLGRKAAEVRNVLQALAEADIYLAEWVKAKGEYGRVAEDGEQFFKDLPGLLQGKSVQLQDASRVIAWTLFENREKLEGRIYRYNIAIGKRAEDVLDRLAEERGINVEAQGAGSHDGEDFDFDVGEADDTYDYQPLIGLLKEPGAESDIIDSLVDICTGVVESEGQKKSGAAALKAIAGAHAKLAEIDLTRAAADTYDAMERQLTAIVERASTLLTKLRTYQEHLPEREAS